MELEKYTTVVEVEPGNDLYEVRMPSEAARTLSDFLVSHILFFLGSITGLWS